MTKNAFHFTLKALFVLEIFTFLSWLFGYAEEQLDKKTMVNFADCHRLDSKYLQYTYYPISQEINTLGNEIWSGYKI